MARPATAEPLIHHLADRVIPPLRHGNGCRLVARRFRQGQFGDRLGEPLGRMAGEPVGIRLEALPKCTLDIRWSDLAQGIEIVEVGGRQEQFAVTDIPQKLSGVEKPPWGQA